MSKPFNLEAFDLDVQPPPAAPSIPIEGSISDIGLLFLGKVCDPLVKPRAEAQVSKGITKYGVPLQPFNGRSFHRDLEQEIIDATQYALGAGIEARFAESFMGVPPLLSEDYFKIVTNLNDLLTLLHRIEPLARYSQAEANKAWEG
jgi:hypothetical protein